MRCATALAVAVCRLSRSVSSHVSAIHLWNVHHSQKLQRNAKTPYFVSSRSSKVIDVDTIQKLITSACYDKQYVCLHLQLFSSKSGKITNFQGGSRLCRPTAQTSLNIEDS